MTCFSGHHGKTLTLLKKGSKKAPQGFKRKKMDVMGSFQEVKAKIGQGSLAPGSRMAGISSGNASNLQHSSWWILKNVI